MGRIRTLPSTEELWAPPPTDLLSGRQAAPFLKARDFKMMLRCLVVGFGLSALNNNKDVARRHL